MNIREIKFRVWSMIMNRYIEYRFDYNDELNEELMNNSVVFQQYTGLKDKNGIEIYEGDIIQYLYEDDKLPSYPLGEVYFSERGFWSCKNLERVLIFNPENSVVVGNIFENSDLIK